MDISLIDRFTYGNNLSLLQDEIISDFWNDTPKYQRALVGLAKIQVQT